MAISRRDLLALTAMLPGFGALMPGFGGSVRGVGLPLPHDPGQDDEADWERISRAFVIAGSHLNTGTYGACPIPVIEATIHHLRAFERITRQEHPDLTALHASLERLLGAWPGSISIVRNTTEAMSVVAAGIELAAGDEVLTTTHEHAGGRCCWELHAARHGSVLRSFDPPLDPASDDELVDAWLQQVTPRTRVMSISHVLFTTGMIQPVARLVREARSRGIISVIDGAHPPGMLAINLREIDADYYATSPHKWLLAPKGTGLLITRPDRLATTWPLIASAGWNEPDYRRFEHVGTINESLVAGLAAAVDFHEAIGSKAIEERSRGLATRLFEMLDGVEGVELVSPRSAAHRSAIVSFRKQGTTAQEMQARLGAAGIRTRRIAEYDYEYLRLSTAIYVLPDELEAAVELVGRER